jgi:molybdate transport system ATP-binding protein
MALEVRIRKKLHDGLLDVDLESGEDRTLCLLGESSEERTLVLRCIAGLETPDEGRIALDGRVLFDSLEGICLPPEQRRVGCLLQGTGLFSGLTVRENIRLSLLSGGRDLWRGDGSTKAALLKASDEGLSKWGLAGLGGLYPENLTRSQMLLALFARMMASDPKLVLLDDPFRSLDGFEKAGILQKTRDTLAASGVRILFASADRDEVYAMGGEIAVLHGGKSEPAKDFHAFFKSPETVAGAILSGCENITRVHLVDPYHAVSRDWGRVFCFRKEELPLLPDKGGSEEKMKEPPGAQNPGSGEKKLSFSLLIPAADAGREKKGGAKKEKKWRTLPADLAAIGIRAEDFLMEPPSALPDSSGEKPDQDDEKEPAFLAFPVREPKIREELSRWCVTFRTSLSSDTTLTFSIPKADISESRLREVHKVYIPESKILWLRDGR